MRLFSKAVSFMQHKRKEGKRACKQKKCWKKLLKKAKVDMSLRQKLFDTRNEKNPVSAFCKTCRELGYETMIWI